MLSLYIVGILGAAITALVGSSIKSSSALTLEEGMQNPKENIFTTRNRTVEAIRPIWDILSPTAV